MKKQIEDRIKELEKDICFYCSRNNPGCSKEEQCTTMDLIKQLEWIIPILPDCKTCKHKKKCYKWVIKNPDDKDYSCWKVDYCSEWKSK